MEKTTKGRHTATIFVTRHTHQVTTEPCVDELTHQTLCTPRCSRIIIEVRDVEARLIGHGELPYIARLVRELTVELPLRLAQWRT